MKKSFFKIISILLAVAMIVAMSSCTFYERKNKDLSYYKDIKNYVQSTGTIIEIVVYNNSDDDDPSLLMEIDETNNDYKYYEHNRFEITGDNLALVQNRGILEKLHEGDRVVFVATKGIISPTKVTRPIVALSANGEELLALKEGFENYIKYMESRSIFEF